MAEWLKGCEICDAGLCARVDELKRVGMSERQAAKELEKDQKEQLGEIVYPWNALRVRYQRIKSGTIRATPKKTPKSLQPYSNAISLAVIAISQLERIEPDDPKREAAFRKVINWIKDQPKGAMK